MTPIEDLVRQALAQTPTSTTTTDPLVAIDRRVRKARRWVAAGASAVAAGVAAAIVVPLAVLSGGGSSPNSITVGHTPSAAPSNPPGVTTWWPSGAVEVASGTTPGAPSWVLVHDTAKTFIAPINPNGLEERYTVPEPADYVAPGNGIEWVAGSDAASNTVRVSALTNAGGKVSSMTVSGSVVSAPAVVGNSLYLLTSEGSSTFVRHFVLSNDGIDQSQPLVLDGVTEIATTSKGHVWAQGRQKLYEVVTSGNEVREASAVVEGAGDIFGPMGVNSNGDDMWTYDGYRIIGLTPSYLSGCVSCAEGYRLNAAGRPVGLATTNDGGIFVAVRGSGIYYYPPSDVRGAGAIPDRPLPVTASSLVGGHNGGVDFVDDQGRLQHWDPQLSVMTR